MTLPFRYKTVKIGDVFASITIEFFTFPIFSLLAAKLTSKFKVSLPFTTESLSLAAVQPHDVLHFLLLNH